VVERAVRDKLLLRLDADIQAAIIGEFYVTDTVGRLLRSEEVALLVKDKITRACCKLVSSMMPHSRFTLAFETVHNHATLVTRGKVGGVDRFDSSTCLTKSGWDQRQQGHDDRVNGDHTGNTCVRPQGEEVCGQLVQRSHLMSAAVHTHATGFRPIQAQRCTWHHSHPCDTNQVMVDSLNIPIGIFCAPMLSHC
jgi:hypothetical protein